MPGEWVYHKMVLLLYHWTSPVTLTLCLQVTVESLDEGRLVLYPQILLACFALLGTSHVHLWGLLLDLLSKVGPLAWYRQRDRSMGLLCGKCSCRAGDLQRDPQFYSPDFVGPSLGCRELLGDWQAALPSSVCSKC